MKIVNKITDSAFQILFLTGNTGQRIVMTLRYLPTQQCWTMDISYNDFEANGLQIGASPNVLRAYKNIIPFGIACYTTDGLDPFYIDDFLTGRAVLYLMTQQEVKDLEAQYIGKKISITPKVT